MARNNLLSRISINPNICDGKPCRGHQIWVSLILDLLVARANIQELLEAYPGIERENIFVCLSYGAEMTR